MSAALKAIPRKRVGRGQTCSVAQKIGAPTETTVASESKAARGEANDRMSPSIAAPLPSQFALPIGESDAAGHFHIGTQRFHAGSDQFVDLDDVIDDLVRDGFDHPPGVNHAPPVEADPSAHPSGGNDQVRGVSQAFSVVPNPSVRKNGETGQASTVAHTEGASLGTSSSDGGGIDRARNVTHGGFVDPEESADVGGEAGQTSFVARRQDAGLKKSPRKRGGIDHDGGVTHLPFVDPEKPARKGGRTGHRALVNPLAYASPETPASDGGEAGQPIFAPQVANAGLNNSVRENGGIDHASHVTQPGVVDPELIAAIQSLHREHRGLQSAVTAMTLRIKADERWRAAARIRAEGGDLDGLRFPKPTKEDVEAIALMRPRYYAAREGLEALRKECQKELLAVTKTLAVVPWVESVKGFGLPSLAAIIGEAGDLSRYANPAKLWKRFSLHVINGKASKRVKGDDSQGFVARRRAEAHVIGDNLLRSGGPYADLYRKRKAYEIEKLAAIGIGVKPAARIAVKDRDKFMSDGQVHKRALRYVEKRLLLELWRAWRHPKPQT